MTIDKAIELADELEPNAISRQDKIRWLAQLDGEIYANIVCTHAGAEDVAEPDYTEATDGSRELIAKEPYAEVYLHWIQARIHYRLADFGRYNNANAAYEADMTAYRNWYNRTHMPLQPRSIYF